jgi:hypothetical protein
MYNLLSVSIIKTNTSIGNISTQFPSINSPLHRGIPFSHYVLHVTSSCFLANQREKDKAGMKVNHRVWRRSKWKPVHTVPNPIQPGNGVNMLVRLYRAFVQGSLCKVLLGIEMILITKHPTVGKIEFTFGDIWNYVSFYIYRECSIKWTNTLQLV